MRRTLLAAALCFLLAADWPAEPDDAPWQRTELGVDVQDVVAGTGEVALDRAGVEVHYTGMLEDGSVFDSSLDRDQTFRFRLGGGEVIRGWEDGLIGMRVGGTRRLVIPAVLGYGDKAAGPIPPGSVLYFEVQLVGLTPPRLPPAAPAPVDEAAWRPAGGDVRIADVVVGEGPKVKVKAGRRACIDFALFGPDDAILEDTWGRAQCTWYSLRAGDLPPVLEQGLPGMREGGTRRIEGPNARYEVRFYSRDQ